MTKVIHIRDKIGHPNEIYIGRGSKWGNPYKINSFYSREDVLVMYKKYMRKRFSDKELLELQDKTLVCYCKPLACHGDVLIERINKISSTTPEAWGDSSTTISFEE